MSKYKFMNVENSMLKRLSDGACIPVCDGNRDYLEYLASGETPAPWKTDEELAAEAATAAMNEARRSAVQARLESLIAELNEKYGIALATSLSISEASAVLMASEATMAECNNLNFIYETLNKLGGIKPIG